MSRTDSAETRRDDADHTLPASLPRPAVRALLAAGITTLAAAAARSDAELLALHGVGPKAVRIVRAAVAASDEA